LRGRVECFFNTEFAEGTEKRRRKGNKEEREEKAKRGWKPPLRSQAAPSQEEQKRAKHRDTESTERDRTGVRGASFAEAGGGGCGGGTVRWPVAAGRLRCKRREGGAASVGGNTEGNVFKK
jgi:hypothetical protein